MTIRGTVLLYDFDVFVSFGPQSDILKVHKVSENCSTLVLKANVVVAPPQLFPPGSATLKRRVLIEY
jgi:hypothetical protein